MQLDDLFKESGLKIPLQAKNKKAVKFFNELDKYQVVKYTRSASDFLALALKRGRYYAIYYGMSVLPNRGGFISENYNLHRGLMPLAGLNPTETPVMHHCLKSAADIEDIIAMIDLYSKRPLTASSHDPDLLKKVALKKKRYERNKELKLVVDYATMRDGTHLSRYPIHGWGLHKKPIPFDMIKRVEFIKDTKTGEYTTRVRSFPQGPNHESDSYAFQYLDRPFAFGSATYFWPNTAVSDAIELLGAVGQILRMDSWGLLGGLIHVDSLNIESATEVVRHYKAQQLVECLDHDTSTGPAAKEPASKQGCEKFRASVAAYERVPFPG